MNDVAKSAKEIKVGTASTAKVPEKGRTPETELIYTPAVDICEDGEHLRLVAEMPGAEPQSVSVTVEKNILTLEGEARVDIPAGCELVGQEYRVGRYRRDFVLPDSVQGDGIKARMQHGLLEVILPKRAEVKTRKIAIEVQE